MKPVDIQTKVENPFRSNSYHITNVKHCIEFTYIDSVPSYHVGFSPFSSGRIMISLLRNNVQVQLYQRKNDIVENYLQAEKINAKDGETFLVCMNSAEKTISAKDNTGSINMNHNYTNFDDPEEEWYVFFDGAAHATSTKAHVRINIGLTPFNISIPEGYFPWIYGIDGLRNITHKKITFHCPHNRIYQIVVILIPFVV